MKQIEKQERQIKKTKLDRYNELKDSLCSREVAAKMGQAQAELDHAELMATSAEQQHRARTYYIIGSSALVVMLIVSLVLLWQLHHRNEAFKRQFNDVPAYDDMPEEETIAVSS